MGHLRAAFILLAFFCTVILVLPFQAVALALRLPAARKIPQFYYGLLRRIIGIKVEVHGTMITEGPILLAANHVSYLDMPILGGLGRVAFIAKDEVGRWPFFGLVARLARTIFVDRKHRHRALHDRNQIQQRLKEGDCLVLFPEGTSSDGNGVLPFRSALLSVAELDLSRHEAVKGRPYRVRVQPVSIAYTRSNGVPMGRAGRAAYAWYGDMDFLPHLWRALAEGPLDVVVEFHPPVTVEQLGDRKKLTQYCERTVREGVVRALAGLPEPPAAPVSGAPAPATEETGASEMPLPSA
jgi:1-acyl-sn-glycerol-3-phosphate acyltransferase